jgi:hypothetical protein
MTRKVETGFPQDHVKQNLDRDEDVIPIRQCFAAQTRISGAGGSRLSTRAGNRLP